MDPTQCLKEMREAFVSGDFDTARERAEDLSDWLNKGGFCPTGESLETVRASIAGVLEATTEGKGPIIV